MAEQNISIKIILDKLLRYPLMQDLSLETAVDYAVDFMRLVGMPGIFEDKEATIEVKNYRAKLPEDYYQINSVFHSGVKLRSSTEVSFTAEKAGDTYKIQGGIIFSSLEKGELKISYQAISTDNEGYPTISDNSSFTRGLEMYIKKQWFTILFESGKIQYPVLQNIQQEYAWAVGDCQTEFNRMSLDRAESFYNSWRTLILRDHQYASGFKNDGAKQILNI